MIEKRALLVGSSFSAAPILFALKKHGIKVSVCGKAPNDPCHQYADSSFYVDYSNPEELISILDSENFDFLVPTCNDFSYMSCAKVAEKYKFPGFDRFEIAAKLHTKDSFRAITKNLSIPAPQFIEVSTYHPDCSDLCFPLLVKPVDSFSGRGMTKVADKTGLPDALLEAKETSRSQKAVLEEFIEGSLHSHSAFVQDGRIELDFFVDEFCTVYPYQVNCSNHPSLLSEQIRSSMRESINLIVNSLDLCDGLIHTQFIVSQEKFWIIETMRRSPGDLYGSLIELSTSIDYADFFVRPFIGMSLPASPIKKTPLFYGRHTISTQQPLSYFSFTQTVPAEQVDFVALKGSGEKLEIAPFDKLGIIFALFKDKESMSSTAPILADFIKINKLGVPHE